MAIISSGDEVTVESIPLEIQLQPEAARHSSLQQTREMAEREHIIEALNESEWNVSAAARRLNIERTNLHKRIRALGVNRKTGE
jgi:two-component system, NtrC family, nitrogen regulation response regulator NtrX